VVVYGSRDIVLKKKRLKIFNFFNFLHLIAMPAKATLFNSKCEAMYEFGTGSRNECFFNPHGNLLCLAGFGNLRGRVEVWSTSGSNKVPQEVSSFQVDDTTYFQWSPDGEHILTATTAPRLRVSNGFKLWTYLGENKFTYQMPANSNELWQVQWQPGVYPTKTIIKKPTVPIVKEESILDFLHLFL
jgi:translation initiation factor 2A